MACRLLRVSMKRPAAIRGSTSVVTPTRARTPAEPMVTRGRGSARRRATPAWLPILGGGSGAEQAEVGSDAALVAAGATEGRGTPRTMASGESLKRAAGGERRVGAAP